VAARRAGRVAAGRLLTGAAAVAVAFAVAALVVAALSRLRARLPADTPNARSLHAGAVPRGGGLAILAGFVPAALFTPPDVPGPWTVWIACTGAVALVSFVDDVRSLPAAVRLLVQLASAGALAWWMTIEQSGIERIAATGALALVIAWGANLFNFMDGSDGLAGSMAVVGFAAYAIGAVSAGESGTAFAALAVATLPFLFANRPPASLFMGDVGAVPLGFLAAAFGIAGVVQAWWPAWFPALVFLPFLGDATLTLARRLVHGERVWQAHRTHYYQRLNALGAGHRGTLIAYGGAMLACATVALACLGAASHVGWIGLGLCAVLQLTAFTAIEYHSRRTTRSAAAGESGGRPGERER